MSVTRRLILSFSALISLFFLFGLFTLYDIHTLTSLTSTIYHHPLVVSNAALQSNTSIAKMHRNMKDVVLFKTLSKIQSSIEAVNEEEEKVHEHLDIVKNRILGEEGKALAMQARKLFDEWRPIREEVIRLVFEDQREKAGEITTGKGAGHVALLEEKMLELTKYARKKASDFMHETERVHSRLNVVTILFWLLGILTSTAVAFFTIKQILLAEKQLQESETKYRRLFETANDGILLLEKPELKILHANPAITELLGYSIEEFVGGNLKDVGIPEDIDTSQEILQILNRNGIYNYSDALLKKKDGQIVDADIHMVNKAKLVQCNIRDITERKLTEKALLESEERYRLLTQKSLTGIYIHVGGFLKFVNNRFAEMLGYAPEEMVGRQYWDFIHPEDREMVKNISLAMARGEVAPPEYEFRHQNKDGETVWVHNLATIIQYQGQIANMGNLTQINDRKQAEEALRESEARYREILENVLVGAYQVTLDGKFLFANRKMIRMFGFSSYEELKATGSIAELYARPEERTEVVDEIISNGFINDEFEFKRKNGQSIWVKLHTRKATNKDGAIILEGLMEDVTETKKMATLLQQSQKMEAIGTLAGGIAHDFNNILAIILGNAELAADDVPDWNPASASLKEIHQASIRAKDMVQQLLAFSRKTDEESKPTNIAKIIKESMKMLRSVIPTSVEFKQHISDDPCNVMGDATQINQIVMNLVTNAADAMSEEGGFLEVTLENILLQEEKSCFDWVLSPGPYVRLKVRDTGEGIEPKIMDRIFEPFYTTKEVGKGTGMGLSLIHGIVKRHGGGVRAESELGKGTLFEIYFPALEKTVEEEKAPNGEIRGGSERILFVDDEESMVNLNRQRLERLGYQVKTTTQPLEALEWFKTDPDQFDVIITDMTMPRMAGDRLAAQVLEIRPHMPVIICTGYSERMSEKKAEALGVRKYIEKPIELRKLASALREVLDEK
ncbi:MAG: PAS domain S-box protein [Deltaproteobacteria bacterium]|nr:PAS domain S-box protein [Deltaproteobacteria bacterium]